MAQTEKLELVEAIEDDVSRLTDAHLDRRSDWYFHDLVPWERGESFRDKPWDVSQCTISENARTALVLNLLTEDNLPYYFRSVERYFGADGAWGTWVRRWTAEEGRHAMVIYGYLMTTRAVDPVELERARMVQVSGGHTPEPDGLHEAFVYLSLQELATRISHRNTGLQIGDPVGYEVMKRVCADENLPQLFYRDLAAAAFAVDPNTMMISLEKPVRSFSMPGVGIPDFDRHAALIAKARIYDLQIHHEQILAPVVLRQWDAANIGGLSDKGAAAQERLMKRMATSEKVARRFAEKRESSLAPA